MHHATVRHDAQLSRKRMADGVQQRVQKDNLGESRKAVMKLCHTTQAYKVLYHKDYSVTATVYDIHHIQNRSSHTVPSPCPVNSTMQQHNMYGGCARLPVAAAQRVLAMCRSLSWMTGPSAPGQLSRASSPHSFTSSLLPFCKHTALIMLSG